ncbi:cell division protein ZapA [Clostridium guangxiense]|uniref:cell division protein ZapA n=2 Tax=Clostridium TaxID=1485 RepID=UPI001E50BA42|nr:cell division protein ZapA [Clostridium guangxiense]MCD2345392.1 cell division protein ZapA [Clostridium guangxiense]
MNLITIKINGMEYCLRGEEKEEYLRTVEKYVDKKIKNIIENNEKLSTADAAILTALNVADDMFKTGYENDELIDKIEIYKKRESDLKIELQKARDEIGQIKKKNQIEYNKLNEKLLKSNNEKNELLTEVKELKGLKGKDTQVEELTEQLAIMENEIKKYKGMYDKVSRENKDLKFTIHSLKYKVIDLENKYLENQIDLAKTRKQIAESLKENAK